MRTIFPILFSVIIQSRCRDLLLNHSGRSNASELAPESPSAVHFDEVRFDESNATGTRPVSPISNIPVGVITATAYARYLWGMGREIAVHDITDNSTISEIIESVRYNIPSIRLAQSAVMIIFLRKRKEFWQDIEIEFDIHYNRKTYNKSQSAKTCHIAATPFGVAAPTEKLLQPYTRLSSLLEHCESMSKRHYFTRITAIINS